MIGELSVKDLKEIIKDSNDDMRCMLATVTKDVGIIKNETQMLKEEIKKMKEERERDQQKLYQVEDQLKKRNLIFKGVGSQNSLGDAVRKVCKDELKMRCEVEIISTRKLFESNGKMAVVAEFRSEQMVVDVLKHTKNLAGSMISIEYDLNSNRQQKKKVMLELKKNILAFSKKHKVSVRNDKLRVADKWFSWSKDHKLVCGKDAAGDIFKTLYDDLLESIKFDYEFLVNKVNSKN